jgi:hypothetical protein
MARGHLVVTQILAWADAYHACTGSWPKTSSGPIPDAPGETWCKVDGALRMGRRGLAAGSSLPRLLAEQRGVRPYSRDSRPFDVQEILMWADAYHARTGRWPRYDSGKIPGTLGIRWWQVDRALRVGLQSLPGGSSLSRLLAEQRGVPRYGINQGRLTEAQILVWVDAHRAGTGHWPTRKSGRIVGVGGETWRGVDLALRLGRRGLPGGCTLGRFVAARRPGHRLAPLTEEQILAWADAHHARTGHWPKGTSDPVDEVSGLTWSTIDRVLAKGSRGLPGGSSLAQLLTRCRGVRYPNAPPAFTVEQILGWADAHCLRTGVWPKHHSGPIDEAPEDTWARVDKALLEGNRGLPGRSSLAWLLTEYRGVRSHWYLPELTVEQILQWADAHHERTGRWPTMLSGSIVGAAGETWCAVNQALYIGFRGLPGRQSLARLLTEARGVPNRRRRRD